MHYTSNVVQCIYVYILNVQRKYTDITWFVARQIGSPNRNHRSTTMNKDGRDAKTAVAQ